MLFLFKKVINQKIKFKKYLTKRSLNQYLKGFKNSGINNFVQFPVRIEGKQYVTLGKNISINAFVHIWGHGEVEIGDDTLIASHVAIISITHDTNAEIYRKSFIKKKVIIGKNVWIGSHATILPGVTIGDNAVIGAGAVVNKNIPANSVAVGIPARIIKTKI